MNPSKEIKVLHLVKIYQEFRFFELIGDTNTLQPQNIQLSLSLSIILAKHNWFLGNDILVHKIIGTPPNDASDKQNHVLRLEKAVYKNLYLKPGLTVLKGK